MGAVFKQSLFATTITFFGAALGAAFNFLSAIVLAKQQLGISRNMINSGAVIQLLLLAGTSALLQTYARKWPAGDARRSALFTACMVVPVIMLLFFLVPYAGFKATVVGKYQAADVPYIAKYYFVLPVLALLFSYMTLLDAFLIAHTRISVSAFNREIVLRLLNLLALGLYYYHVVSFSLFVLLIALCYAVPVLVMLGAALRTERLRFVNPFKVFTRVERTELGKFSAFHLLAGISGSIIGYVDSLMLAPLDRSGMNALAVYSIAVFIVSVVSIPFKAMTAASFSSISEAYVAEDYGKLQNLYHRTTTNVLIATMLVIAIILCNLDNAILLLPPGYEPLKPIVYILVIGRVIDVATGTNNDLIGISKFYRFAFYAAAVLLVVVVVLNRILIPKFGYYGAAWSATAAMSSINIVKMIFLRRRMGIVPFTPRVLYVIVAAAGAIALSKLLPFIAHPIIDAAVRSVLISVIFAGLIVWLKPSEDIATFLTSVKNRVRR